MLTAIVVGVATLGLALALCLRIYQGYGTIEEDELLAKMESREIRSKALSVQRPQENPEFKIERSLQVKRGSHNQLQNQKMFPP